MTLHTALCTLLGIEWPIFCAPMGFVTGAELAAAVSEAGGLGELDALPRRSRRVRRVRHRHALDDDRRAATDLDGADLDGSGLVQADGDGHIESIVVKTWQDRG